jgi:rare lipoprotein A
MKKQLLLFWTLCLSIALLSGCAEVELASHVAKQAPIPDGSKSKGTFKVGTPYKVAGQWYKPKETYSFEQTGIASWYGPNFHGKKTANGETFDMYELTAAHKTLQIPSLVRVTNLENGRSIVVRINDRGPFSKGRIIDLSKRGAELLGFKNQGTARVKLQILADESRQIAHAAKQGQDTRGMEVAMNEAPYRPISHTPPPKVQTQSAALPPVERADIQTVSVPGHVTQGKFYPDPVVKQYPIRSTQLFVQAASFGNPARAEQFASTLSSIGSTHIQPAIVNGQNFYRVRIGPLRNVPEADSVLQRLASIGQNDAIVVVD